MTLTSEKIANAEQDLVTLDGVVNGDENTTVVPRVGAPMPSLRKRLAALPFPVSSADLAAAAGANLVGFKRAEAGAVQRTALMKLRDIPSVEDFGAVGDGVANDTAALQAALNTGKVVAMRDGATYLINVGLSHVTGAGFVCDGRATIKAKTGAGGFNITSAATPREGTDRNMLVCALTDGITLLGVHFTLDGVAEVVLHGIRLLGGMATEGYDIDVSFSNFDVGSMVAIGGTGAGKKRNIRVRSAVDSGITQGNTRFTAGAQTTVVEIDNDKPSSAPAIGGNIQIDVIKNILYTGAALASFGQETDGVNIICQGANSTSNWNIVIGKCNGIGEPIDIQGWRNSVRIGTIENAYNDAIKLIHGARDNYVEVGTISYSGRSAVSLHGSGGAGSITTEHTEGNVIRVGTIIAPCAYGLGLTAAPGDGCAVLFANTNSTWKPQSNVVEIGSIRGDGVNLDVLVKDGGADDNLGNLVIIGKAMGYTLATANAPAGNVRVRTTQRSYAKMTMSAAQSINSNTATKLLFNTIGVDTEGLAVPASNKFTAKFPGIYRVSVRVRADGWQNTASDQWTLEARQNAGIAGANVGRIQFAPGKDEILTLDATVHVKETDVGTANADITAWLTHTVAAARTVSNAVVYTYFEVERIG